MAAEIAGHCWRWKSWPTSRSRTRSPPQLGRAGGGLGYEAKMSRGRNYIALAAITAMFRHARR